jgi:RNA polymerase sigma factor (sigma-70 family)
MSTAKKAGLPGKTKKEASSQKKHRIRKLETVLKDSGGPRELFRKELEIPVKALLSHKQELNGARKISVLMARLKRVLPYHPLGYRLFTTRMDEVANDVSSFFAWHEVRPNIEADLRTVTRALRRAENQTHTNLKAALSAYDRGVKVLLRYPLDPETLYQWSKEVAENSGALGVFCEVDRFRRIARIIRRLVRRLDEARDRLVMPNLRLVMREVFRFPTKGMYESDLFQEGFLGLSKAVFRFDPERNLRFSTYATHWIRQSIRKALIDKSSLIRLPQALHEKRGRRRRKMSEKELERLHKIRSNMVMFSAMADGEEDNPFDVRDRRAAGVTGSLHTRRVPRVIRKALLRLSESEREVVSRRFGLDGSARQTLEEIGSHMHLSRERIRQIEKSALEQMRELNELSETYEDLSLVEPATIA